MSKSNFILFQGKKAIFAVCGRCNVSKPIKHFKRLKNRKRMYSCCSSCKKEERYIKELLSLSRYKVPEELILLKKAHLTLKRELCQQQ